MPLYMWYFSGNKRSQIKERKKKKTNKQTTNWFDFCIISETAYKPFLQLIF